MAYIALYRNYRPTTFSEVAGQKYIIKTLKNGVVNNKISHAYIFSGQRGIGKTTIARILAKAVNCLEPINGEPCNKCKNCLSIINNETSDIVEIDAASNNGVDEMRDLLEKVNFLPSTLKKKVYIIDEVHMLSISAFNALLKTLEEPPAHVMFVLATTEPHKIPMTILSRCQRFDFKQLNKEETKEKLKEIADKENILIEDDALYAIAEASEGGMRDAISILDQVSAYAESVVTIEDVDNVTGKISNYKLTELIKTFNDKDAVNSLKIVNELLEIGKEPSRIINNLINYCRDLLLYKNSVIDNENKTKFNSDFTTLADSVDTQTLFYYIDILVDVTNKIKYTSSSKLYLEVAIMKIISPSEEKEDFNDKLANIEDAIKGKSFKGLSTDLEVRLAEAELKIKKIIEDLNQLNLDSFKESTNGKLAMLEEVSLNQASLPNDINNKIEEIENNINQLKTSEYNTQSMYRDLVNKIEKEPTNEENSNNDLKERVEVIEEYINGIDLTKHEPADINVIERLDNIEKKIEEQNNNSNQDEIMGNLLERMNLVEEKIESPVIESKAEPIQNDNDEILEELIINLEDLKKELDTLKESTKTKEIAEPINQDISEYKKEVEVLNENYFTIINSIQKILGDKIYEEDDSYVSPTIDSEKIKDEIIKDALNEINLVKESLEESININKEGILNLNQKYEDLNNNFDLTSVNEKINDLTKVTDAINSKLEEYNNQKTQEQIQDIRKLVEDVKEYNLSLKLKYDELKESIKNQPQEKNIKVEEAQKEKVEKVVEPIVKVEPQTIKEEPQIVKEEQNQIKEPVKVVERIDDTERVYDIKIVERILHESRTQDARGEKVKIVNEWPRIPNYVGTNPALEATACLLRDGTLTANGHQELLIVYPDASLCNHLMSTRVHKEACEILKLVFNKNYDFMALPENTWQEKRKEYYSQYAIGISKPVLSPIRNNSLKAIISKEEPAKDNVYERVSSFFGSKIIRKEE